MDDENRASAPTADNSGVYHLRLKSGDVPPYAILPGAPERTEIIASYWKDVRQVASYREFKTVTGAYEGVRIGCTSTGIGGPSSEICINELNKVGVHTCIRVGTTGCIVPDYDLGDLIIPAAAVRGDGTSDSYIGSGYPAYADPWVVMALSAACDRLGYRYGIGLAYTSASFYIGQARPLNEDGTGYWPSAAEHLIPDLAQAGVTNIEMETAAQFVVGRLHGMRMGAVLSVISNRVTDRWGDAGGEARSARAAAEALRILNGWDRDGIINFNVAMPPMRPQRVGDGGGSAGKQNGGEM
ncbi:MAG: nucleoside phosphorylase [Clostridiales Family XIII bacterium]|jgi:uridine phosphorylase|nr:nucleoside phosphorylase [Clostridiales Family XIII bacterium]